MTTPAISISHVTKQFGNVSALKDITFDIADGHVVAIVGPSGSGKSTLCRCINKLETISGGQISVYGQDIPRGGRELAEFRSNVGMVFQSFNLFPNLTIIENITLAPIKIRRIGKRQAESEARLLLNRVGIADQAEKRPSELSGGQQQRAAIARALAMRPKLVLFDEPTSALDPESIKEVLAVMLELASTGMTMVIVTHEMEFARKAADKVAFMADGCLVEYSNADSFFAQPQSERARSFLSQVLNKKEFEH